MLTADLITRCHTQLRLTPLLGTEDIRLLLKQAIRQTCVDSMWREDWFIILCKQNVARYFLPANHIATTAVFYNNTRLFPILAYEANLLHVETPTYYTEDDWQDEASSSNSSKFVTHLALNDLWPLQLMRSQLGFGRKVITLISAPTTDGDIPASVPIIGMLDGSIEVNELHWPQYSGAYYLIPTTTNNLVVFCCVTDQEPISGDIEYNDMLSVLYMCKTLSLALASEDDESDLIRSAIYEEINRAGSLVLKYCFRRTN